jgi:hypothetical protein
MALSHLITSFLICLLLVSTSSATECVDVEFRFAVPDVNGSKRKSCYWASRKAKKIEERCLMPSVMLNCPETCGFCTDQPSSEPSAKPSKHPSAHPSAKPSQHPSAHPTTKPSQRPSSAPTSNPSQHPTTKPSQHPSASPTSKPSQHPSAAPTSKPSQHPTEKPSQHPSAAPTSKPSQHPSAAPTSKPSSAPTSKPSSRPSTSPSYTPTELCEDVGTGDDVIYKFDVPMTNGSVKKSCYWAVRREKQIETRCAIAEVMLNCPKSCDLC